MVTPYQHGHLCFDMAIYLTDFAVMELCLELCIAKASCISIQSLRPDFGKPARMSHLVFQEILISNIEITVAFLC